MKGTKQTELSYCVPDEHVLRVRWSHVICVIIGIVAASVVLLR